MKTTICALSASLFGLAGMAYAQQRPAVAGHLTIGATDQTAALAYWTPERMANAKPMPLPTLDPATASLNASPLAPLLPQQFSAGAPPAGNLETTGLPAQTFEMLNHGDTAVPANVQPDFTYEFPFSNYQPPVQNAYPYATVGKLFFVIPPGASEPAGDYVCSGSVTANKYTVLTARHCMYDVNTGIWYNSWVFDPAYNSGPNPTYGNSWTPRQLETWVTGSTYDYDIGFMQMNDMSGTGCNGSDGTNPIGYYTGYLGYTYNGSYAQRQWSIFGFPQASPFAGNHLYQDDAATGTLNPFGTTNIVEAGNPQTGGTSGGPWVIGLIPKNSADPAPSNNTIKGGNFANGVNSFQWTSPSQPLAINGPEFQTYNFLNLFTAYKGLSCP